MRFTIFVFAFYFFGGLAFAQEVQVDGTRVQGYESAIRILGRDFIAPHEIASIRGIVYTKSQLNSFLKKLPEDDVLLWAKENGYALVAGPPKPMSLLGVRSLKPDLFWSNGNNSYWYIDEVFAKRERVTTKWLLIRKEPVANSFKKSWGEQLGLLLKDEQVPSAPELSWFITTFYELRGIALFGRGYVRTSSVTSGGYHILVGCFDSLGVRISYWHNDDRHFPIGLASSRRF